MKFVLFCIWNVKKLSTNAQDNFQMGVARIFAMAISGSYMGVWNNNQSATSNASHK